MSRPPTGEQYLLRRGDATARIGQVAAVLREFSVGGTHYTETWPDSDPAPHACGIVLMPWPNRVADARWHWEGELQQLDITEVQHGNASHGLLRDTPYQVADLADDSVTLTAAIYPQHGWPFTLETAVTYTLTDVGLRVTHRVSNMGAEPAVFGCGAHPYLRVGDTPVDELTVTVRAASYFEMTAAMIPTEKHSLTGGLVALPHGAPLRDLDLDTGFADLLAVDDLQATDGAQPARFEHVLSAPDGRILTLWADADFRYTIVYTPDDFPNDTVRGPAGQHRAVAIEPMTCPTNALNSGEGLITLQPGEIWCASWGLTPGRRN
jgi:aldose 1-epimerase